MFDARLFVWNTVSKLWKKVSRNDPLPVITPDSAEVDAFGRKRVSEPTSIYECKFLSSRKRPQWEERLTGAIIVHGAVTGAGFAVDETITGGTSGMTGVITAKTASSVTFTTSNNDWIDGETITGGTSGSTAEITTHNTGADIVYSWDSASVLLSLGTVSGQKVIRQTVRYFPYVPGFSHRVDFTGTFDTGKANVKQTVMYGDGLNGLGFVLNGTTMNVLKRTSTSGSAVDTLVPQSEWNVDRLDSSLGLNPSGITLDITKSQILSVDFQWLGIGRVRMALNIGGVSVGIHDFRHANEQSGVYMRTPALPIRYEIENTGTAASASMLEQICSAVIGEGGHILPGVEFSACNTWAGEVAVTTTRRPIHAFRLKSEYPAGKPNRKQVRVSDFEVFARTNEALIELVHVHNPLTMTATWMDVDSDSAVEHSSDISALTAEHMHTVQFLPVAVGQANSGGSNHFSAEFVNEHSYISQNFESNNSQMFVLYATSRTATSNVIGHISYIESE